MTGLIEGILIIREEGLEMTEKPFRSVFDGEDICLVNNATNEHFWIIDKNKPIDDAIFKLENHINQIIEDRNELQFRYNCEVLQRKSLVKENEHLKSDIDDLLNPESEDIHICQAGKIRLEYWGKQRFHQFYDGDEPLEDETVVFMLMDLMRDKKVLNKQVDELEGIITHILKLIDKKIEEADYYRKPITEIEFGADLGYWNGVYQQMKELKKEILK